MPPPVVYLESPAHAAAPSAAPAAVAPRGDAEASALARSRSICPPPVRSPPRSSSAAASRSHRRVGGRSAGAQCVQVLLSAKRTWKADGVSLSIVDCAARMIEDLKLMGIDRTLVTGELAAMSMTILTIDNFRTMRDMLMLALTDAGYRVVQAVDGVHGLDVLEQGRRTSSSPTSICPGSTDSASSSAFAATTLAGHPDPCSDHGKLDRKEEPGAPRRRDRLDREAVRFGEAGRRRSAGGCLTEFEGCSDGFDGGHQGDVLPGMRRAACRDRGRARRDGRGRGRTRRVNAVFRAVHSIKGGAGAFQLDNWCASPTRLRRPST